MWRPGLTWDFADNWWVQGRSDDQRELLDAESVAGHLLKPDSVFAFLAAHRHELFPEEMFADLFPSRRGRPSLPAEVKPFDELQPPAVDVSTLNGPKVTELMTEAGLL